jgi:tRNA(Ile2) C34 agmatinyltransferase TiaS
MIYVGLDDTDIVDSPGTNQLARQLARELAGRFHTRLIVRHQLLEDPRVPCTNKNGCAALVLEPRHDASIEGLADQLCPRVVEWSPPGSDPGLCIAAAVPAQVINWGRRCQRELVTQGEARRLAAAHGVYLKGLGGTEGGVIGALAAVGLAAGGDDARVIYLGASDEDFYDLAECQTVESLYRRGIDDIRCVLSGSRVISGVVDVGKRLRPNICQGKIVLFVSPTAAGAVAPWQAIRKP